MMRFGTGFGVGAILITHMHADHFIGVIGLVRTLGLQGREETLHLCGPPGSSGVLDRAVHLGMDRIRFPVEIREVEPGERIPRPGYEVEVFPVKHGTSAVGYAIREPQRLGRFDVERVRALGVPEGPLFGRIHRGEAVEVAGRTIHPEEVVGPPRPGRSVVYTGDTRPAESVVEAARGADLLIHDCTFAGSDARRARETFHSTAGEAAGVARKAGALRLALTHLSARYSDLPEVLEREARKRFPDSIVARDGLTLDLPFLDEGGTEP